MDGFKVALSKSGMTVEEARQCAKDRKELNEFHTAIFAWACVLSDRPLVLCWLSLGDGWDVVT